MEKVLRELEFAAILAEMAGGSPYPAEELERIWKEVLLYQFHDILPGSSIKRVYDESLERYRVLAQRTERMTAEAYGQAVSGFTAAGGGAAVFNSLPWERKEWLKLPGGWQEVSVPPMGFALVEAHALEAAPASSPERADNRLAAAPSPSASAKELRLENDRVAVRFGADGAAVSIFDKENSRQIVPHGRKANRLTVYADDGDAWDFRQEYRLTGSGGDPFVLRQVEEFADGPTVGLIMRYTYGQSELVQRVVLTGGSRRIDFETTVDWRESGRMLRTSFPVNVRTPSVTCDIQFGYYQRPTHRNTMWDYARDEICAHHYIDLSEPDYGVALLNDCKYGHRAEGNELDLNLLRSPSFPDPEADRGSIPSRIRCFPTGEIPLKRKCISADTSLTFRCVWCRQRRQREGQGRERCFPTQRKQGGASRPAARGRYGDVIRRLSG
ncbi:hypothetical protein N6H14_27710 [Paenibacillus sp. CC-CFT747]|nr:hypothetical protein N6H14_27710 [Paenibacillus sp. CC-CFT747]